MMKKNILILLSVFVMIMFSVTAVKWYNPAHATGDLSGVSPKPSLYTNPETCSVDQAPKCCPYMTGFNNQVRWKCTAADGKCPLLWTGTGAEMWVFGTDGSIDDSNCINGMTKNGKEIAPAGPKPLMKSCTFWFLGCSYTEYP